MFLDRKFDIQFFGEDSGGGTDGGGGDPKPEPKAESKAEPKAKTEQVKAFTQEQVDKIVADRLTKERKKYEGHEEAKEKAKKFDDITAQKLKEAGEYEKLLEQEKVKHEAELAAQKAKLEELEASIKQKEFDALKTKVATEEGLKADLADRLRGTTEEELRADAKAIASFLVPQSNPNDPQPPKPEQGVPIGNPANPPSPKPGANSVADQIAAGIARAKEINEKNKKSTGWD
jgi:hypothetical protein